RGIGFEYQAARSIVLVVRLPFLRIAGGSTLVDLEHDLAVAVAVDDVLAAEGGAVVGERFDGSVPPAVVAGRVGGHCRVRVSVGSQASGAGGAAVRLHDRRLDTLAGRLILEVVVGVAGDLPIRGREGVEMLSRQSR